MAVREAGASDARIALVASWSVIAVIAFQGIASMVTQVTDELNPTTRSIGVLSTVVCCVLFVLGQRTTVRNRSVPAWQCWVMVVAASAGFAVGAWINVAVCLGLLALVLSGRWLAVAVVTSLVAMLLFLVVVDLEAIYTAWYLLLAYAIALLLYVLTRIAVTVGELILARETVSRLRVDEERHRISRDLHDVLGRSLVAISLRVQTLMRTMDRDPQRSREQLDEIARMIADGQSRLRGLTLGEQVTGLVEEVQSAQDLFSLLNIRCEVDLPADQSLRPAVDELGARVVRECVTNLLKHSRPTYVEISLREESTGIVLVVLNDGTLKAGSSSGTGLTDLVARVEDVGGTMEAGHLVRERFRVLVRVPHTGVRDTPAAEPATPSLAASVPHPEVAP